MAMMQEIPPLPKGAVPIDIPLPSGAVPIKPSFQRLSVYDMTNIEGQPLERKIFTRMTGGRDPQPAQMPEEDTTYKIRSMEHFDMVVPDEDKYNWIGYGLSVTPNREIDKVNVVKKLYGDRANVKFHEGYGDYVIEFDDGRVAPLENPGFDKQSLIGSAQTMLGIGEEIAGGIGGIGLGVPGVALGASGGAAHSEYNRLKSGQGLSGLSDAEITSKAALVGAMTLGFDVALGGAGMAVRRFLGNPAAKKIFPDLSKADIDAAVRAADKAGEDLTTSQAMAQASREAAEGGDPRAAFRLQKHAEKMAGGEEGLMRRGEAEKISEVMEEQGAKRMTLETDISRGTAETTEAAIPVGENIIRQTRQAVTESENNITTQLQKQVDDVVTEQYKRFQSRDLNVVGASFRDELKEAEKAVLGKDGLMSKAYNDIWEQIPSDTKVDMAGIRILGKKWHGRINEDAFPSLTEESRVIINDALRLGIKGGEVKVVDPKLPLETGYKGPTRKARVEKTPITEDPKKVETISRAISQVKKELRLIDSGASTAKPRQKSLLVDLKNQLESARDIAIKDVDPNLQQALRDQDAVYASAMERIHGSMLGRIIKKKRGGGWKIVDDKVMSDLLKSPSDMRDLLSLARDYPEYDVKNTLKEGLFSSYGRNVVDGNMKHQTFMNNNKSAVDSLFTPAERRRFDSGENAQRFIAGQGRREAAALRDLKKTIGYKLSEYNPSEVYKAATKNLDYARKAMKVLSPERKADFQSLYMRDVLESARKPDGFGGHTFDLEKLRKFRTENAGMIKEVLGNQYYQDMSVIENALKLTKVPKKMKGELANAMREEGVATAPLLFWRALYARPLSRMGVATTAGLKLTRSSSRKALDKLLADPKLLRDTLELYNGKTNNTIEILKNVGLAEVAKQIEDME